MFNQSVILLGEIRFWSLKGLKGLNSKFITNAILQSYSRYITGIKEEQNIKEQKTIQQYVK